MITMQSPAQGLPPSFERALASSRPGSRASPKLLEAIKVGIVAMVKAASN